MYIYIYIYYIYIYIYRYIYNYIIYINYTCSFCSMQFHKAEKDISMLFMESYHSVNSFIENFFTQGYSSDKFFFVELMSFFCTRHIKITVQAKNT